MSGLFQQNESRLTVQWTEEMIQIASPSPLTCLSSAVVGGGMRQVTRIINRHVDKEYHAPDPSKEIADWLAARGMSPDKTVVLLTAAYLMQGSKQVLDAPTFGLTAWVTAGIGNAARAGKKGPTYAEPTFYTPGTINILLLIEGDVTPSAMVNGVITATEAKAAALADLGVTDQAGLLATGTTTDAVAIFATQKRRGGITHPYAGTLSPLGQAIARAVHAGVVEAVENERRRKR
ncbi:adenosylcobinamide amidohydrolase [Laceyella putida]|uniref:Adenosylcobinamide amidohydrolase n=1 Tax=Laceyella putida TaxID=110101 RepID=A0ABW2RJJ9_9BACL